MLATVWVCGRRALRMCTIVVSNNIRCDGICVRHWRRFVICPRLLPKPECDGKRINVEPPPPCELITRAMQLAVMDPADWNDEFVAYAASERSWLCEGEMVRIRRHPATDEARLPQYESSVILIAQAHGLSQSADHLAARLLLGFRRGFLAITRLRSANRDHALVRDSLGRPHRCHI